MLARRAEMGAALTEDDAFNPRSAVRAGCAFFLIDFELVLKMTAFVRPIKAGAVMGDGGGQRFADAGAQAGAFLFRQAVCRTVGADPRGEQGFVGVDVADPRAGRAGRF